MGNFIFFTALLLGLLSSEMSSITATSHGLDGELSMEPIAYGNFCGCSRISYASLVEGPFVCNSNIYGNCLPPAGGYERPCATYTRCRRGLTHTITHYKSPTPGPFLQRTFISIGPLPAATKFLPHGILELAAPQLRGSHI